MNLSDIFYQLKLAGWEMWTQDCTSTLPVEAFSLYPDPLPFQPEILYVAEAAQAEEVLPWGQQAPLLLLCPEPPRHLSNNILVLKPSRPLPELINFLSRLFAHFQRLLLALNAPHIELFSLMNQIAELLDVDAVLIDSAFQGIAYSDGVRKLPIYYDEQEKEEVQKQIIWEPDFFQTQETRETFLYENTLLGQYVLQMLCHNLFVRGHFYARFALTFAETWKTAYLRPIFTRISQALEEYFQLLEVKNHVSRKSEAFYSIMQSIVNGAQVEDIRDLNDFGWFENQEYQVYQFRFDSHFPMKAGREFLLDKLEEFLGECFLTKRQTDIICVCNRSICPISQEDSHQPLAAFLAEYIGKAGVSNCFHGLLETPHYVHQADWALKWGERKQPTQWYHFFRDYVYEYLMEQCVREFPAEQLIAPELLQLWKCDQEKGSSLFATLETYVMTRCNGQATAQKLFIHRTTFLYRMKQIQKITKLNAQDPETYKKLLLSFELWERR